MQTIFRNFVFVAAAVIICVKPAMAGMDWIDLPVSTGGTVKALVGVPDGVTRAPGVVYSHGSAVRRLGYDGAKKQGYDISDYVKALNEAGYVAIAPVRHEGVLPNPLNAPKGAVGNETTSSMQAGIEQGIASLVAATDYLKDHPTASGKVAAVGFSEGGLVTTWAAIRGLGVDAFVLMSPATIKKAKRLNMKNASQAHNLGDIRAPVLITMGTHDNDAILKGINGRLIPALKSAGVAVDTRTNYPGNHSWFWRVRPEHFSDVLTFLDKYLK